MLMCIAELGSRVTVDRRMAVDGKYKSPMPLYTVGVACMPTTFPKQPPSSGKAQCQHACSDDSVSCSRGSRHAQDSTQAAGVDMPGLGLSGCVQSSPPRALRGQRVVTADAERTPHTAGKRPQSSLRHCKMGQVLRETEWTGNEIYSGICKRLHLRLASKHQTALQRS